MFGLMISGCLQPDPAHCIFGYGDRSCVNEDGEMCVLGTTRLVHEGVSKGCTEELAEGFVHVPYGLPEAILAPASQPEAPRAIQGMLAERGYIGTCTSSEELESYFRPTVVVVGKVRRHLEERGRVRRSTLDLTESQSEIIRNFADITDDWIQTCSGRDPMSGASADSDAGSYLGSADGQ